MKVNKLTLLIFLAFIGLSSHAISEWKLYADMDGGQGFYDPNSIKKIGKNKVNVLTYINLPEDKLSFTAENGIKFTFSNKVIQQYDCKAYTYDFLETELYSAYDLKGDILKKEKKSKPNPKAIGEDSPAESLVKVLCK